MSEKSLLSQRIRSTLVSRGEVSEGSFMGGTSFWLGDHLAIAIHGEDVLVRVPDNVYPTMMERSEVRPYEFAARPVPNWVIFAGDAADESALEELIELGLEASS